MNYMNYLFEPKSKHTYYSEVQRSTTELRSSSNNQGPRCPRDTHDHSDSQAGARGTGCSSLMK